MSRQGVGEKEGGRERAADREHAHQGMAKAAMAAAMPRVRKKKPTNWVTAARAARGFHLSMAGEAAACAGAPGG